MTATRICGLALVLFAGLSLTDYALTYAIVTSGIGYESNPVAEAWLDLHGWEGLGVFKVLSAAAFMAAVVVICRHRPRSAAALGAVGCAAVFSVVIYSCGLLQAAEEEGYPIGQAPPAWVTEPAWGG